jgi:hypothetical protein
LLLEGGGNKPQRVNYVLALPQSSIGQILEGFAHAAKGIATQFP